MEAPFGRREEKVFQGGARLRARARVFEAEEVWRVARLYRDQSMKQATQIECGGQRLRVTLSRLAR